MKISDLISKLSNIKTLHGDLPLYIYRDTFDEEELLSNEFLVVKSGADPAQAYIFRPSANSPVWKKRVLIG